MKTIAILPLRKGSKGIPGKNRKKILGRALYQWVLGEAIFSDLDQVYVFTDDQEVLVYLETEYAWTSKVIGMPRSAASATDTASTESAMVELAEKIRYDFDVLTLLQATSPLTTSDDINRCLKQVSAEAYDACLTVVETKRFIWNPDGTPVNYDYMNRPRRQDFNGLLMENGAVYATTKQAFQQSGNRISGRIGLSYMAEESLIEIDEPHDFTVVEKLLEERLKKGKQHPEKIKAVVFDVDGVLTNGTVLNTADGELAKAFSLRDGMGFNLLAEAGVMPVVMTSERSGIVDSRMKKLEVKEYFSGVRDKYTRLGQWLSEKGITAQQVAYIGDDINDLANICRVGWSFCPSNGVPAVRNRADIVLHNSGGDQAVREAIEFIINYNKRYTR